MHNPNALIAFRPSSRIKKAHKSHRDLSLKQFAREIGVTIPSNDKLGKSAVFDWFDNKRKTG